MNLLTHLTHSLLAAVGVLAFVFVGWLCSASPSASDDILARSRALYASLRSYADTGTVDLEFGPPGALIRERHTFKTYYRAPRHFLFEFREDLKSGGDQVAIWCDGGDFQSWWSATRVHEVYAQGRGASAFSTAAFPTNGSAVKIPPLLFSKAGMESLLTTVKAPTIEGTEEVGGQRCHKLTTETQYRFGSQRPVTLWIDAETLLVRRILEGTPRGAAAGTMQHVTTTFEPQANPDLDDSRFRFSVPGAAR